MMELRKSTSTLFNLVLPLLICAIGVGLFVALAKMKKDPGEEIDSERVVVVRTVTPQVFNDPIEIDISGLVVPYREITLSAKVAGIVKTKSNESRAGTYVTAGTPLIEIDPEDFELERDRLDAEVDQAQALIEELDRELEGSKELVELANREVELQELDFERKKRIGRVLSDYEEEQSERAVIQAKNARASQVSQFNVLTSRKIRLAAAKTLAEKQLQKAELDLRRTKLVAPSDGVVVADPVEVGTYVQKGANLILFEDTSKAEISCSLQSSELYWILKGQGIGSAQPLSSLAANDYRLPPTPVDVIFEFADESVSWKGRLDRLEGSGVDEKTRSIPCRVVVDNPVSNDKAVFRTLVRGMYVTVRARVNVPNMLLQIPSVALRPGNKIWIARPSSGDATRAELDSVDVTVVNDQARESMERSPAAGFDANVVIQADPAQLAVDSRIVVSPLPSSTAEGTVVETERKSP